LKVLSEKHVQEIKDKVKPLFQAFFTDFPDVEYISWLQFIQSSWTDPDKLEFQILGEHYTPLQKENLERILWSLIHNLEFVYGDDSTVKIYKDGREEIENE
jgi:hypothetical protein